MCKYGIRLLLMSLVIAGKREVCWTRWTQSNVAIDLQGQSINAGDEASRERRVRSLFSRVSSFDSCLSLFSGDHPQSNDPGDCGHITMYVRESCKDSFDSVRVPYARFGWGRLSLSVHVFFIGRIAISSRLMRYNRDSPTFADLERSKRLSRREAELKSLPSHFHGL